MSSIDPLATLVTSAAAFPLVALIASVAALILSVFCALLAGRQQHRLAAMQTQLDDLSSAFRDLKSDHERLFIRSLRSSSKGRKSPSQSSGTLEEKMTAPTLPDENKSTEPALYVGAPKTSPE
jgi:hypothetical protein